MTIFVLEEQNQKLLFASEKEAVDSKVAAIKEFHNLGWSHYYGKVREFNPSMDNFKPTDYNNEEDRNVVLEFGNEGAKKCKRIARKIHAWWRERNYDWDNYDFN